MSTKGKIRAKASDKKIKRSQYLNISFILIMFGIVLYDSFRYELPFHYILYAIAGLLAGNIFSVTGEIMLVENSSKVTYRTKPIGVIIGMLLLVIRFYAGRILLEAFNVLWITDAVYLFFIGIYLSKIKAMIRQIDNRLFTYLFERAGRDHVR